MERQPKNMVEALVIGRRNTNEKAKAMPKTLDDIAVLKAVLADFKPVRELRQFDVVEAMFDEIQQKNKDMTYDEIAALLKQNGFDIDGVVLRALMAQVRRAKNTKMKPCPCCETVVPESKIRDNACSPIPEVTDAEA